MSGLRVSRGYIFLCALCLVVTAQPTSSTRAGCQQPRPLTNANLTFTGLTDGAIATYTCFYGYQPSGNMQKTCTNGLWTTTSGAEPYCIAVYCVAAPTVQNANPSTGVSQRFIVGSVVNFTCNNGYYSSNSVSSITCLANQTWSRPLPQCLLKDCGPAPAVPNGNVTYASTTYNSEATYVCNLGYDLVNSRSFFIGSLRNSVTAKCNANGDWINVPLCQAKTCPTPPALANAAIKYSTNSNSYKVGDYVEFTCSLGFQAMENMSTIISCSANQLWSRIPAFCVPVDCGTPLYVANSNASYRNTTYNSLVTYSCNPGYEVRLVYDVYRTTSSYCTYTGKWTNPSPCLPRSCGPPPYIAHGIKVYGLNYIYQEYVVYECFPGYRILGNQTMECQADGSWSQKPDCTVITCKDPPVVQNAVMTSASVVTYGNSTYYHCNEGYRMSGYSHVTCREDGSWTDPPSCSIIDCHYPTQIRFGFSNFTSTTYKSKAFYSCQAGYQLVGRILATCSEDGTWSTAPVCEPTAELLAPPVMMGQKSAVVENSTALSGLAITCVIMGITTLLCIVVLLSKTLRQRSHLFSYASFKNGEESISSHLTERESS